MARVLRLVGAAVLACVSVPLLSVAPAYADTAVKAPTNFGYFNSTGIDKPDASPADPPNLTSDHADGVGPGHLAVAAAGGKEDKVSFLLFDVFDLDPAATLQKAVVRMVLVPNTPPNDLSFQAAPEKVVACMAGSEGFSGDEGNGLALAPKRLCDKFKAVGKATADGKAYEFDVTGLAATWLTDDNEGIAFTSAPEAQSSNFQVVFDKPDTATLSLTYTGGTVETVLPPVTTPVDSGVLPQAPASSPDFSSGGGFAPAPSIDTPIAPSVELPAVPNPTVNQPPVAAVAQPVTRPAAALSASMRPTTGFWLAGLALIGGLALISLIMGDTAVPTVSRSRSRLSLALTSGGGSSLGRTSSTFRARPV